MLLSEPLRQEKGKVNEEMRSSGDAGNVEVRNGYCRNNEAGRQKRWER